MSIKKENLEVKFALAIMAFIVIFIIDVLPAIFFHDIFLSLFCFIITGIILLELFFLLLMT